MLGPLDSECQCYVHTAAVGTLVSNQIIFLIYYLSTFKQVVRGKTQIDGTFEIRVPEGACQYVAVRHRPAKTGCLGRLQ